MPPSHHEHYFIKAVESGCLKIYEDGSVYRVAKKTNGKLIKITPKEIKYLDRSGYVKIVLKINCKAYTCYAHRVVWTYFNGNIPNNKEINHRNCIKQDNRIANLELVTKSENHLHAHRNGRHDTQRGEKIGLSKLTSKDIIEIRRLHNKGAIQGDIAYDYSVTQACISDVVNGKTWRHVS